MNDLKAGVFGDKKENGVGIVKAEIWPESEGEREEAP